MAKVKKFIIYVGLYCKDTEGKAFDYEYSETVESELEDRNGQFNYIVHGAIEKAIRKVEGEYQNSNVETIHVYKVKEGWW